jgi:MFS family permease
MRVGEGSLLESIFGASPLRHARFRLFFLGTVGSALGYTMQATVAAWLMATLTPSALMVALVQTASTAPSLLFGLVAGSLADIVDRRRVVLFTQLVLVVLTLGLGLATLAGSIGPTSLLVLTFLIGAGFTIYLPAQQATVNDLVVRADLHRAVALGAIGFNLARAAGPALAGAIAAWIGTGSAFIASAGFFVVMAFSATRWTHVRSSIPGVRETLLGGVQIGLRYARHSDLMRAILIHNLTFSVCASALWALLPVIARDQLGLGAGGFGLLSGAFGTGAVIGALTIPRLLERIALNVVVRAAIIVWVAAAALIAWSDMPPVSLVGMMAAGGAWVGVFASLSAGTQSSAPAWVRARAVAMSLVTVQGSLALGSAAWGWLASASTIRIALFASAATMALLLLVNRRVTVRLGEEADVTPGAQLPDMAIVTTPRPDDGPVLVQIEYRIPPENRQAFVAAIHAVEPVRRRNGAHDWRAFRDLSEPDRFVERYILTSWAEYERLRSRMTVAEHQFQDRVLELQERGRPVKISRFIGLNPHDAGKLRDQLESDDTASSDGR